MAEFNFDNLALNLPDALRKDKDSNNYKLLYVEKLIYDRIMEIYRDIEACLNIDNCTGVSLDKWGDRWSVARGKSNDDQYRLRIKSKIGQSFCDGSRDSIAKALAYMLSSTTDKIKIKNGTKKNTIVIVNIPLEVIKKAEFDEEQVLEVISGLLSAGVEIESFGFDGTFELGATWGEQDANKGLSDLERTTGGYLGTLRR